MAPELIRHTRKLLPQRETCPGLRTQRDRVSHGSAGSGAYRRAGSCPAGALAPASTCGSTDETGKQVEVGKHGELVARGANIMRGYWNDPEETALAFRNGMFRTGDIGYQDSEGYFYILDRLKDMIVTGGENVYSGEVEAVIYKHPAVREAAVFGIPDPQWGEIVMACVVLKPGMHSQRR